jgi:hypothetical protein
MSTKHPETASTLMWVGRVLSGLVIAFLVLDASMKLVPVDPVMVAMRGLGFESTINLARGLGALLLLCTILHAIPRTSLLGALLLTGYLGGAIAIQLRTGSPLLTHVLFGAYLGIALWAGLLIRRGQVRSALLGTQ